MTGDRENDGDNGEGVGAGWDRRNTITTTAVRTVDDIVDYTKRNCLPGILIAIDFEKAFNTLNFKFLITINCLHKCETLSLRPS